MVWCAPFHSFLISTLNDFCNLRLGTAVELYGSYTNASYVVSLDDGPLENNTVTLASTGQMLLASFNGLQNSEHTVTLIAHPQPVPSSYIAFDRAVVTATVDLIK